MLNQDLISLIEEDIENQRKFLKGEYEEDKSILWRIAGMESLLQKVGASKKTLLREKFLGWVLNTSRSLVFAIVYALIFIFLIMGSLSAILLLIKTYPDSAKDFLIPFVNLSQALTKILRFCLGVWVISKITFLIINSRGEKKMKGGLK